MNRRVYWAAAVAIVLIALLLRTARVARLDSLSGDEAQNYGVVVGSQSTAEMISILRRDEGHPPLPYLLDRCVVALGGEGAYRRRIHLVALGTLAVALVMLLALRAFGPRCALLTGIIAATSPYFIYSSTEFRSYSLYAVLTVLYGLALLRLLRTSDVRSAIVWGVAAAALALTHYFGFFLIAASGLYVLSRRDLRAIGVGALTFLILFGAWLPGFFEQLAEDRFTWATRSFAARSMLLPFSLPWGPTAGWILLGCLLLGVFHIRRAERPRSERMAFTALVVTALGGVLLAWLAHFNRGVLGARYLVGHALLLLPAACLYGSRMGSLGDIPIGRGRRLPARLHGALALGLLVWAAVRAHRESEWSHSETSAMTAAARTVEIAEQSNDRVVVSPAWSMLSFCHAYRGDSPVSAPPYAQPLPWLDTVNRFAMSRDDDLIGRQVRTLAEHLDSGGRVWFVMRLDFPGDPEAKRMHENPAWAAGALHQAEYGIHFQLLDALHRHGTVVHSWETDWDEYRFPARVMLFKSRDHP